MRKTFVLVLGATLALAACQRGPESEPLSDNMNTAEVGNVAVLDNAANAAAPTNATNVAAPKAAPAPAFTDEQQMKDDADASGMTARLPDEDQGGNETAPVKQ